MPDTAQPPVFINQMPDYQDALKKLTALAGEPAAFATAVQELGLDKEFQAEKQRLAQLNTQGQWLDAKDKILAVQDAENQKRTRRAFKDTAAAGGAVSLTSGLVTAAIVAAARPRRFGFVKAIAGGLGAALATATAWAVASPKIISGPKEELARNRKDAVVNHLQKDQVTYQAIAGQNAFLEAMATRMLERQKSLEGEGAAMKLVSTAQTPPSPATSLAAKYASRPNLTKAEQVEYAKAAPAYAGQTR